MKPRTRQVLRSIREHAARFVSIMLIVAIGRPDEKIVLTEIENGQSTKYYRDEQDVHYVPKRKLEDIVI